MAYNDMSELIRERKDRVKNLDPYEVASMFSNLGPNMIEEGYRSQMAQGNPFGAQGSGLLGSRAQDIYNQRLGNVQGSILRNAVFDDARRSALTGELAAQNRLKEEERLLREAEARARKKARKKGFMGALGGLAGAAVGAAFGGVPGAFIGQGAGGLLGGGR